MTLLRLLLLVVIWPICAMPAQAQFFRKKPAPPPPSPAQRVPEMVMILKTDPDERKRASAAEDLREFDPQTFSEMLPVLIEAARSDPKVGVRMEAITTLSKLRPVTREAGQAIEHAASDDSNLRARVHARTTLWKYQLAGYSGSSPNSAAKRKTTDEPPLLEKPSLLPPTEVAPGTAAKVTPITPTGPDVPRPLPTGPAFTTAVPQKPRVVSRPAAETTIVEDDLPPLPPSSPPPSALPGAPPPPLVSTPPPLVSAPPPLVGTPPPPLPSAPPPLSGPSLPGVSPETAPLPPLPGTPPPSTTAPIPLPEAPPVIVPLP